MAATWIPMWAVRYDGSAVVEYRVSRTASSATVRDLDQTSGGARYHPRYFETQFAATREGAIELFLARKQRELQAAHEEVADVEAQLRRAEALRETLTETVEVKH